MTDQMLLACPFCGGEAISRTDGDYHVVGCRNCSAETADEVKRKAIAAWNRRVPLPQLPEAS